MRVLLTGGGSGGHVNPAIAIAETIKMNIPDAVIEFVGVENGKECDLVPRAGYRLHYVDSQGFSRSLSPKNIKALMLALHSPHSKKTQTILKEFQPDIVIGTGGFVCWPLVKAAANAGIPTILHESNCKPGLAVKMLQGSVDKILLNFPETLEYLKKRKKCEVVGNPLRSRFGTIPYDEAREQLKLSDGETMVLASAGSLGSEEVNEAVLETLRTLAPTRPGTRFVLSTGKNNYEAAKALYDEYELFRYPNVELCDYIYDMALYMAAADVVITRAGAISLSELAGMGKAAIVIPSPHVADNHQLRNAQALSDRGAALLVEQKDFSGGALPRAILTLLDEPDTRRGLEKQIREFSSGDANRRIYELIVETVESYRSKRK